MALPEGWRPWRQPVEGIWYATRLTLLTDAEHEAGFAQTVYAGSPEELAARVQEEVDKAR